MSLGSKRMPAAPPAPELSCAGAEEARWKSSLAPLPGASSADKNMELSGLELLLAVSTFSIFSLRTFCFFAGHRWDCETLEVLYLGARGTLFGC